MTCVSAPDGATISTPPTPGSCGRGSTAEAAPPTPDAEAAPPPKEVPAGRGETETGTTTYLMSGIGMNTGRWEKTTFSEKTTLVKASGTRNGAL